MKNTSAGTKHSHTCTMAFGRYSAAGTCPRCDELRNGAPARLVTVRVQRYGDLATDLGGPPTSWARRRPSAAVRDARFTRELLREHRAACHCGPVCTFGDW